MYYFESPAIHVADSTTTITSPNEFDLCSLLQTMKLEGPIVSKDQTRYGNHEHGIRMFEHDEPMDDMNYHSDEDSEYSSASSDSRNNNSDNKVSNVENDINLNLPINNIPNHSHSHSHDYTNYNSSIGSVVPGTHYGCAYLQNIRSQFENYVTTGGEYLEVIFTHREILSTFPAAHRECARVFSDLAFLMERRSWRADRDADTEAVTAFRHEAWMIASVLAPPVQQNSISCIMTPMY